MLGVSLKFRSSSEGVSGAVQVPFEESSQGSCGQAKGKDLGPRPGSFEKKTNN